jgi:hypothetical protein
VLFFQQEIIRTVAWAVSQTVNVVMSVRMRVTQKMEALLLVVAKRLLQIHHSSMESVS